MTATTELQGYENDGEPCHDCGTWLPFTVPGWAVDGATICGPCATARYGDRAAEYKIT
jgi:hypothetical protein